VFSNKGEGKKKVVGGHSCSRVDWGAVAQKVRKDNENWFRSIKNCGLRGGASEGKTLKEESLILHLKHNEESATRQGRVVHPLRGREEDAGRGREIQNHQP